ncbi:MAG: hypothetical protein Q7T71_13455 [Herbiconiux sp.]|nr:hypothetical protein [Herbiconiux sp.]
MSARTPSRRMRRADRMLGTLLAASVAIALTLAPGLAANADDTIDASSTAADTNPYQSRIIVDPKDSSKGVLHLVGPSSGVPGGFESIYTYVNGVRADHTIAEGQSIDVPFSGVYYPKNATIGVGFQAFWVHAPAGPLAATITPSPSDPSRGEIALDNTKQHRFVSGNEQVRSFAITVNGSTTTVSVPGETIAKQPYSGARAGTTVVVSAGGTTLAKYGIPTAPAPALSPTPTPVISGAATVGSTLTVRPGTWGPAPVALTPQWKRDGASIPGATGTSYVLTNVDAGTAITVTVTATKAGYPTVTRTSAATARVTGGTLSGPVPKVSGDLVVGSTLTATVGAWQPGPVTLTYAWKRGGTAIAGATAKTYALVAADAGKTITVTVTAAKSGFAPVKKTSAATAAVKRSFTASPVPKITGTTKVGSKLTAVPGTWSPTPATLSFQWKRGGIAIAGATTSTYTLTTADRGKTITVTTTGTKTGYATVARTSTPTSAAK